MYDTRKSALRCAVLAPFGLHRQRQFQQFGLKMVERELLIVKRPSVGKGIVGIKQRYAQRAGDRKDPRQTNGTQCLQPVCILHDFASGVVGAIFALKLCASIA